MQMAWNSKQECDQGIAEFKRRLTDHVDRAVVRGSLVPFKSRVARQGLLWRIGDTAQSASDALWNDELVTAAILIRSLIESSSALHYVSVKVNSVVESLNNHDAANEQLSRVLLGRRDHERVPAINVLTYVDRANRQLPHTRELYDDLSEITHPNWSGTVLLFSRALPDEGGTDFGKYAGDSNFARETCKAALFVAMSMVQIEDDHLQAILPLLDRVCSQRVVPE
jgi:hypothetical protein